ncbi:unnamed protein product [Fusarium langsethiae]|nr:unnamed protein product [Fusarium langsethiae]
MQFSLAFLAAVLSATSVSAAPADPAVNMMAATPQWTIQSMQRNGGPVKCGDYTVTSGWSGQFGPGNGFTTFSVVSSKRQIVWPAYTDKQVQGGKVVKPDQSYTPANLPQ